ncbi:outer membrane porin protein precursor [Ferrovum sp. JA12]|jgi:predicted porin|uniref:porin n=1 Tax=Ferrovum sp. JA12 TaxID=1356299 RepID=UPI000703B614|nr:porin [Ferrovum sp. JA12]KRH79640.1 outer membrane porin protein precursor [Ferrovum sp. JA12]
MKKSLLALAALASVASVAHAQDGIQLYGVLDMGVAQATNNQDISKNGFVTGLTPTSAPYLGKSPVTGTVDGLINGGQSATRWGIKGSEDLGSGRKAFFVLESGFNLANGQLATSGLAGSSNVFSNADTSLNGQLFGRQAYLGLSDNQLGQLEIGRVYNVFADVISGGYDPVNFQEFSPINFSGFYGGGGQTDNFRVDNSLKYEKTFGNYKVKYLHSFGGISNSYNAGSSDQASVGYENSRFGVQAGYQYTHDVTGISFPGSLTSYTPSTGYAAPTNGIPVPNGVNVTYNDLRAALLAGRYNVNQRLSLKGGIEYITYTPASNYAADATLTNVYSYTIVGQQNGINKDFHVFFAGGTYDLTPKQKISAGYYWITVRADGGSGYDKYASVAYEYYLSKRTNFYAAVMNDTKSGVAAVGYPTVSAYPSVFNTYGVGVRHLF